MISIKSCIKFTLLATALFLPSAAFAQEPDHTLNEPFIKLDRTKFWSISKLSEAHTQNVVKVADNMHTPTLSPDGNNLILFKRPSDIQGPGHLYAWRTDRDHAEMILESPDASEFITWTSNDNFYMREHSAPFAKAGMKLNFSVRGKQKAQFKSRTTVHDDAVIAYDLEDLIVMQHNNKVQAISDLTVDRYSGPQVSPRNDFIVFEGLKTGINLFDVKQNRVIYQNAQGAFPRFSPDGRYLVYSELTDDGHTFTRGDIIIIELATQRAHKLHNPNGEIRVRATLSDAAKFVAWETVDEQCFRAELNIPTK